MLSTITVNGVATQVVTLPATPGFESIELSMFDAVAIVSSLFTGQTQAQQWPGADMWTGTATLPKLTAKQKAQWTAFLAQLRGMALGFLVGDPAYQGPQGSGAGTPVVDSTVTVAAGSQTLYTAGWTASSPHVLLPGDYLQIGYRLHLVLDVTNSDSSGKAAVSIWPSLREVPAASAPVILANPVGLFRLAQNKRGWRTDYTRMTDLSFQIMEYR